MKTLALFSAKVGIVSVAVVVIMLIGLLIATLGFSSFVRQASAPEYFYAEGRASRKLSPDSVSVNLGERITGTDTAKLQNDGNAKITKLVTELKKLGIKDEQIRTSNYSLYPVYDKPGQYEFSTSVEVRIEKGNPDASKVKEILTVSKNVGMTEYSGFYFFVADEREIVKELEGEAITDAKKSAQERASLAGLSIGRLVNIAASGNYPYPMPYPTAAREMAVSSDGVKTDIGTSPGAAGGTSAGSINNIASSGSTYGSGNSTLSALDISGLSINPGQVEVISNVTLTYELN
jgi:hypothetical protein